LRQIKDLVLFLKASIGIKPRNFLTFLETKSVVIVLALGYPAGDDDTIEGKDKEEVLENMDREDLNELVYWERYQ